MEIFTVCFFGHRKISLNKKCFAEEQIYKIISKTVYDNKFVDFLVGRNGEFDQIVSSCIVNFRKTTSKSNFSLTLVLPYLTAEYLNNEENFYNYYNSIEISESKSKYFKSAFERRNKEMIDRADLCIFFVEKFSGGAYKTMEYAQKQGKK